MVPRDTIPGKPRNQNQTRYVNIPGYMVFGFSNYTNQQQRRQQEQQQQQQGANTDNSATAGSPF